ncbi:MAG: hypothetical protein IKS29_07540 [Oscillospiraceae bacterium]|nr:hypothetical protein [Oscillospiraceae bacterium]
MIENYVNLCLSMVPRSTYRDRAERELRTHLKELTEAMAGCAAADPEAAALRQMGDPEILAREYRDAWRRQPERVWSVLRRWALALCLGGCCYLAGAGVLSALGFTYDQVSPAWRSLPMLGDHRLRVIAGVVLYLSALLPTAVLLRVSFRDRAHCRILTTLGLLVLWLGEKASLILLSAMLYGMPPLQLGALLHRMAWSGDPTAPWFTLGYLVWTLAASLLLGIALGTLRRKTA